MFILIVRNDRLGDLILALPTVTALCRRYPDARLAVVASPATADLFALYPERVECWADDDAHLERLHRDRPDAALFLYPDRRWARAASKARVPERIGTAYRLWAWRFNRRVRVHRRESLRHEAELNLMVARPLLGEAACEPPELRVPGALDRRAADLLAKVAGRPPEEPFVVVHPGSSGSAWNWPPDCFAAAVAELTKLKIPTVVTGGPHEAALCAQVAAHPGQVLAGHTDLPLLGAVLARARLCVAGSTGPLHLAAALGRSVVGLYSPLPSQSPRRWGPLGVGHRIFVPPHEPGEPEASSGPEAEALMRRIRPADVARAVSDVWQEEGVTP
jgi:heptosyltransferase-3